MTALAQVNTYLSNHYEGMTPEQLILLLYKGALDRIELTRQGIKENDLQKRGENLSKVIAIVSELNAAVDPEMMDEGTRFLRGLYAAILAELPKVSVTNDIKILDRTTAYITRLKEIWEKDVMAGSQGEISRNKKPGLQKTAAPKKAVAAMANYGNGNGQKRFNSISI
jgi:flagellar protein FliS